MKENTARQIENLKNQTIGVEVEMYGISRCKAAQIAAEFFGTGNYEDTASENGYYTWSAWDAQGREWKFQRDVRHPGTEQQRTDRTGNADFDLRRHRNPVGTPQAAATRGSEKQPIPYVRSPHPHRES